jgi:hypothetical protein
VSLSKEEIHKLKCASSSEKKAFSRRVQADIHLSLHMRAKWIIELRRNKNKIHK